MKSKRMLSLIMSVCVMFGSAAALPHSAFVSATSLSASAETWGDFEYTVKAGYGGEMLATITAYKGKSKKLTVPKKINDCTVKVIAEGVFKGNTVIESVAIEADLYYLTQKQFMDCTSLKSVTMPDSINFAYYSTFENCTSLKSIKLPDELKKLSSAMFAGCTNLSEITFPKKMESLSGNSLDNTKWLSDRRNENPLVVVGNILMDAKTFSGSSLTIPSNIKTIISDAFNGNKSIVSVTVPSTVTDIGSFVFEDCVNLEKAVIDCKENRIDGLFNRCRNLKEVVLPEGLEVIQNYTFGHCESLKSIKLPSTITEIGYEAFYSCYALSEINLPDGLESIGYGAFSYCNNITRLDLPQSVKIIDDYAFNRSGIKELYVPAGVEKIGTDAMLTSSSDFKLLCHKNSYAQQYAIDKNLKYELLAEYQRYAGQNRFATAAEISKAQFTKADTIILANGTSFADALAGVPLAYAKSAPILLAQKDILSSDTKDEIKRLGAKNVILLGGEGVISKQIEAELKNTGIEMTTRICGSNRFGTAAAIASELNKKPTEIFFVYAGDFADALSVSTAAAIKNAPVIYLKTKGELDNYTKKYLSSVKSSVKKAYVIGGTGVISDAMMKNAALALDLTVGKTITRIAGSNRYETCNAVNKKFASTLSGSGICVAKGLDFPDALAGGVCAAINRSPLVLADNSVRSSQKAYLQSKKPERITIFGGFGAVPSKLSLEIFKTSK